MTEAETPSCIAILVPTLGRPESLRRALSSLVSQSRPELIAEIIVVDNAPDRSARSVVEGFTDGPPIRYVCVQPPGVATARNAGLAITSAAYVAFLDDDEEAPPSWLGILFAAHRRLGADVTFGPVAGLAPQAPQWKRSYLERFFSRSGPSATSLISEVYGCGNSLMTRATALAGDGPFDTDADASGGEDDRLFLLLRARGARFAWAAEAVVFEYAAPARATLAYAFTRAIAFGQGPSKSCIRSKDYFGALRWMVVGLGQTILFGAAALLALLVLRPSALELADRALRGVGKVIWFAPLRFYGHAAVEARLARAKRNATATNRPQTSAL